MEDAHLVTSFSLASREMVDLYAIFDGHCGREAADFAEEHLATYLQRSLSRYTAAGDASDEKIFAALKEAFAELDHAYPEKRAGTTLNVVIRLGEALWICNVGDTRALIVHEGATLQLSRDQKPNHPDIRQGIEKRGGFIECIYGVWRVGRILSVGRALGDRDIVGIVHTPKINKIFLKDLMPGTHLVIACDGIWEACSTNQAGAFLRECMAQKYSCQRMAEALVQKAYIAGSQDNLSALVVRLK
jgi:serine/threonine protein phosphatase PrpC